MIRKKISRLIQAVVSAVIITGLIAGCNSPSTSETDTTNDNATITSDTEGTESESTTADPDDTDLTEESTDQPSEEPAEEPIGTETIEATWTFTQYDGSTLTLEEAPQSIGVHSYAIATILYDLGVENITSVMTTRRPLAEELRALPGIGSPQNPDFEVISSLETDLLFSSSTFIHNTEDFLQEQGIAGVYLDISTYTDTKENIEMLGRAFGKVNEMERLIQDIEQREQVVLERIGEPGGRTIAIMYGTGNNFMFGTDVAYVGEMAAIMGLENIVSGGPDGQTSVAFSIEQLVELDPDIIVRYAHGASWEQVSETFSTIFEENEALANLTAVQNGTVYDLDDELFTANAGTRSIESFETLAETIFPSDGES